MDEIKEKRKEDRRKNNIDYSRRKFNKRGREFVFPLTVYLSDTNAFGNVYFAKYIEWQGKTREDWFKLVMKEDAMPLMLKYKMATVEVSHKYRHECLPFEDVEIGLKVEIKRMTLTFMFNFRFKDTKKLIGIGQQKIAFIDYETNKLSPVPKALIDNIKKMEMLD